MAYGRIGRWAARGATLAGALGVAAACNVTPATETGERTGTTSSAVFTNGGFETGAAGSAPANPWKVTTNLNNTGITVQNPQTLAGLNLSNGGTPLTVILNGQNQADPDLGATASLRWCRYGNQCAIVNQHGNNSNVNTLSQTMTVGAGDVDPADNQVHVRFTVAPVLENPNHTQVQQPYYFVILTDVTQGTTLYSDFNTSGSGTAWKKVTPGGNEIDYTDWQLVDIHPGNIALNDQITLTLIAAGCQPGLHWGELYVDGVGSTIPGLYVSAAAPTEVNAGSNLAYTLTYRNGSPSVACTTSANCTPTTEACVGGFCAETGGTISFQVPPGTNFVSTTTPVGLVCVPPVAGIVTCTFANPLPPGTSGTFTVTVNVPAGTATGTVIAETNYSIASTQESTLLGPHISTTVGCTTDATCPTGNWCQESTGVCTPTLPNGTTMPTDPPHTNPTLNGTCAAAGASALVCTSKVCDTDNKCGYLNGDGPCAVATGAVLCRSAVCDVDLKCGYANGDGPCTPGPAGNGATVCRSTSCSTNGLCEPLGGCNVDADCTGSNWCREATHTCTPKLTNGTNVPTDPPHSNPTLNGTCAAGVGTLTCLSGVCDVADNKCGFATGDGPCTPGPAGNGATVCRSGACSVNGTCEPLGGCDVDGDCTGGNWCLESTHTCTPKLGNGAPVPSDPPHANPVLNGTCTVQAGALVCTSAVCDTKDNDCGYANGDGPCIPGPAGNGGVVCRSGQCSTNGKCVKSGGCNVDADCSSGNWCNESTNTCTPTLPNGTTIPTDGPHTNPTLNGMCTAGAGALVCTSKVCDPSNNECGYANGDGPCVSGVQCQSGACSSNGLCEPAGGCNVDLDCTGGKWCMEQTHVCTSKVANGGPVPTDPPHSNPTLNGVCTSAAGALTCTSGVCDAKDNDCGYANGDGPCNPVTGPTVCRSGACSVGGTCEPVGGCNVDADCTGGNWCNESTNTCTPKLPNGQPVPNDPSHTNPTLNGTCTAGAGALTCLTGVCDTNDNDCGYANGDGPCVPGTSDPACRSGSCSSNGTCEPAGGCNADSDCPSGNWCNESTNTCTPKIPNGQPMPSDPPHTNPTLDGTCTPGAAAVVCQTGVCDSDNKCGYKNGDGPCTVDPTVCRSAVCDPDGNCGYKNGDGPCTDQNGGTVCRSTLCPTTGPNAGVCEQCLTDTNCSGTTPACDATTNKCGQCSSTNSTACENPTPLCNTTSDKCVGCDGDNGGSTSEPCPVGTPYCSLSGGNQGACGKCTTNTDCTGHPSGPICDPTSGACGKACKADTDCNTSTQWCNAPTGGSGSCVPKLPNGTPLPGSPSTVSTCTTTVGTRVCVSGVCDTKDNACGFLNGDGPCNGTAADCRSGACDKDGNCGYAIGDGPCQNPGQCRSDKCGAGEICVACSTDNDCPTGDFCSSAGACVPKEGNGGSCTKADQCISDICSTDNECGLPDGKTCSSPAQCRSSLCTAGVCGAPAGGGGGGGTGGGGGAPLNDTGTLQGGGCAVGDVSSSGNTAGLFGLGVLAMGAAARRARRRAAAAARR